MVLGQWRESKCCFGAIAKQGRYSPRWCQSLAILLQHLQTNQVCFKTLPSSNLSKSSSCGSHRWTTATAPRCAARAKGEECCKSLRVTSDNLGSDQAKNTSTDTLNFISSLEVSFAITRRLFLVWFNFYQRVTITWSKTSMIRQNCLTLQSIPSTHISLVPNSPLSVIEKVGR